MGTHEHGHTENNCKDCPNRSAGAGNSGSGRRRLFLSWGVSGGVVATFASFFYPVIRFINSPHIVEAAVDEVTACKVSDLKPNSGKIVKFGNKPALLVRASETEWKAFSAICAHLDCTVQW